MPSVDPRLSPHFRHSEFTRSKIAADLRIDNTPNAAQLRELRRLAQRLEQARAILVNLRAPQVLDIPIDISSGFRAPAVNIEAGGAGDSAHLDGRAADFTAEKFGTPRDICAALSDSALSFDQLIYEGTWVHLGIAPEGKPDRRELRTAVRRPGKKTVYPMGLL